jgi:hypothetical protein
MICKAPICLGQNMMGLSKIWYLAHFGIYDCSPNGYNKRPEKGKEKTTSALQNRTN